MANLLPSSDHQIYIMLYSVLTILMVLLYGLLYLRVVQNEGYKYLPLIVTARNILLSSFLIFFYNPFRSVYTYGRALHVFAVGAAISLLLTISKFDVLNLVHFLLYGKLLTPPNNSKCKLENGNTDVQISKAVQQSALHEQNVQ